MKANHNRQIECMYNGETISNISKILNESKSQLITLIIELFKYYFQYFKDTK